MAEPKQQQTKFSTLWKLDSVNIPEGELDITLILDSNIKQTVHLSSNQTENWYTSPFKQGHRFSYELSSATTETLNRELTAIQELYEIEPDNKWVILTIMSLMKCLDPLKYEDEILQHSVRLQELDPKRKTYYQDLRSKVLVENKLETFESSKRSLDLSEKGLSVLYHTQLLPLVNDLDLHGNQLNCVSNLEFLRCVKKLNLDNNKICDISGIHCLNNLESLSLKNNLITELDQLQVLQKCSKLSDLDIQDNPVCVDSINIDTLKQLLPNVMIKYQ